MECSLRHMNAQPNLCFSTSISKTKDPSTTLQGRSLAMPSSTCVRLKTPGLNVKLRRRPAVVLGCCSAGEIERELEAEMQPEEAAEWMKDKCCGGGGALDLLECLEREAIMGEDEGKEPNDYNRRAQIFYKSSRVFQALKECTSSD